MALNNLQETFHRLYDDEMPSFINTLNSTQNLPPELSSTIKTVEENIEKNRILLASILDEGLPKGIAGVGGGILGGAAGGIFGILSKKQAMNKFSGKKLVAIQDSASLFEDTIQRMEQLLEEAANKDGSRRNYENLTDGEKKELLSLSEQMRNLSEELSEELAA